jgi:hypothetical protein
VTTQGTDQFRQQDLTGRLDPLPPTPAQIRAWAVDIAEVVILNETIHPDFWQGIPHRFDDKGDLVRVRSSDTEIVDAVRAELRKIAAEVKTRATGTRFTQTNSRTP